MGEAPIRSIPDFDRRYLPQLHGRMIAEAFGHDFAPTDFGGDTCTQCGHDVRYHAARSSAPTPQEGPPHG
jgi:hypothetical protein